MIDTKEVKHLSKGISATKEWWQEIESQADRLKLGRSEFIRIAVDTFLQDDERLEQLEEAAKQYNRLFSPA